MYLPPDQTQNPASPQEIVADEGRDHTQVTPGDAAARAGVAPWYAGEGFQALLAVLDWGVVLQDAEGRILEANPAAERLLGRALDELRRCAAHDRPWPGLREDGTDLPGDQHPTMLALRTGRPVPGVVMAVFHPRDSTLRWLKVSAAPLRQSSAARPTAVYALIEDVTALKLAEAEHAGLVARERLARRQAEDAAALAGRLHALTAALAQAATPRAVAAVILAQGLAVLGARQGSVVLLSEDGEALETLGAVGYQGELVGRWQRFPLAAQVPLAETARTGEIIVLRSWEEAKARFPDMAGTPEDIQLWAAFPLLAGGRIIGGVGLSAVESREVGEDEREMMLTLARQCGQALERARLFESERLARERAERRAERLDALHRLTAALAGAVTEERVVEAITGPVASSLGANGAVVSLLSEEGAYFVNLRVAGYEPAVAADWPGYSATPRSPIGEAVETREVVTLESPVSYAARYPHGSAVQAIGGTGAWAAIPLLLGTRVLGGIGLSFPTSRSFDPEDLALLRSVGELCAQALERTRLHDAERHAAVALQERTAELETLLRVLPIGIGIATEPGARDIRVNPAFAQILGIPSDVNASLSASAAERPTGFRFYAEGRELTPKELPLQVAAAQGTEVRDVELEVVRDDGARLTLLGYAAPLYDEAGRIRGAVGAFLDITARVLAERQRDQFLASMAHDLKNPLTALVGMSQLLQGRAARLTEADATRMAPGLASIFETARGMARQIDDLLDTARVLMRRPLEPELRPVDLAALVRRLVAAHAGASEDHTMSLEGAEGTLQGLYDEARLARALANVLSNALKYSPRGGEVGVVLARVEEAGETWATIRVSDRGIGIPPGEVARVMEPYYRASNARGRAEGTGLGLAGARQIVEAHGGTIGLESEEGAGTTVTLRLPHRHPPVGRDG